MCLHIEYLWVGVVCSLMYFVLTGETDSGQYSLSYIIGLSDVLMLAFHTFWEYSGNVRPPDSTVKIFTDSEISTKIIYNANYKGQFKQVKEEIDHLTQEKRDLCSQ